MLRCRVAAYGLFGIAGVQALGFLPFDYADDDDTPYRRWFGKDFASVFVALNPFLRMPGFEPAKNGDGMPDAVEAAAKRCGPDCGVSWAEIAELCGFASIRHVNRALRLTGSKRISEEFASPEDTEKMRRICAERSIYMPAEGRPSPLMELALGQFMQALGHKEVLAAGHFGHGPQLWPVTDLLDRDNWGRFVELCATDRSVYCGIYIDYHYYLICQTEAGLARARPEDFFEGFYADEETNDFWGVGRLDDG